MTNSGNSPDHFIVHIGDADGKPGQTAARQRSVLQACKEGKASHSLAIKVRKSMQKLAALQMRAMAIEDDSLDNPLAQRQQLSDGAEHVQVPSQRSLGPTKVVFDWHGAYAKRQLLLSAWIPQYGFQNCGCFAHLEMPKQTKQLNQFKSPYKSSLDEELTKTN